MAPEPVGPPPAIPHEEIQRQDCTTDDMAQSRIDGLANTIRHELFNDVQTQLKMHMTNVACSLGQQLAATVNENNDMFDAVT